MLHTLPARTPGAPSDTGALRAERAHSTVPGQKPRNRWSRSRVAAPELEGCCYWSDDTRTPRGVAVGKVSEAQSQPDPVGAAS